ncbi:MAG: methyltransferase domain-containing protein [Candidatus Komeilibacteria bacterium]|nr:methyltransferase domain-containing protein [Candidatus Komeilibacteria bacterium]
MMNKFEDPEKFYTEKLALIGHARVIIDLSLGENIMEGLREFRNEHARSGYRVVDMKPKDLNDSASYFTGLQEVATGSADAVVCGSVLDHVPDPFTLIREIYRVLKPGGMSFIYAPFLYVYHAEKGSYGDYFRFTIDAVRFLFRDFKQLEYVPIRGRAATIVKMLPRGMLRKLFSPFARLMDRVRPSVNQTSGYYVFVIK